MKHLMNAQVLVLGLGDSGLAMARWCAGQGAQVSVWDSRPQAPQDAALMRHVPGAVRLSGSLEPTLLNGVQLVLKSPGLAPADERIVGLLTLARETGVPVQGELDLFARALADLRAERGYAPKVIAITGTNGKTTTTSMTGQLVERTGKRVAVAGNIGPTLLQTLADVLALEPAPAPSQESSQGVVTDVVTDVTEARADAPAPEVEAPSAPAMPAAIDGHAGQRRVAVAPPAPDAAADDVGDAEGADEVAGQVADEVVEDADDVLTVDVSASPAELSSEADLPVVDGVEAVAAEAAVAPALDDEPTGGGPPPHLIPPPPPGPVFEHLPEVWVLELSSFQLDGVQGFEPTSATVLNVTQDHLDWHGSLEAYAAAKARIFGRDAVMVINRDDPEVEQMVPPPVPGKGRFAKPVARRVVRFGLDAPTRPGDFGLQVENGIAWMVRAMESDETIKKPKRGAVVEEEELVIQRLMPADALRVRGRHNASNALAALALATAAGCPLAPMLHGLREYEGEPHRVEFITLIQGVEVYDDSKGTNVGATVAALAGLGEDKAPNKLVVILGGDGKGQDFTPLAAPVQRYVRAVATIGRDAETIEQALAASGVALERHATLEAATRWAFERAQPGDAVLLSPACASLDMFRNYAHRAEVFVAEVEAIVGDLGEIA